MRTNNSAAVAGVIGVLIGVLLILYGVFGIDTIDEWLFWVLGGAFALVGLIALTLARIRPEFSGATIVGGLGIVVYALFPIGWLFSLSLKTPAGLGTQTFLPDKTDPNTGEDTNYVDPVTGSDISYWQNYEDVLNNDFFQRALVNSAFICLISTVISVVLAMFAAYAIARLDFNGKKLVLSVALAIAMFPVVALVGGLFEMWSTFGLYDTWLGLIIPYLSFTLPLSVWVLSAFFREIPWEMEQAAQVDGATSWQAFRKVIVPLAAPGVFTAAILTFFFAWNDFVFGISLASTENALPVPASLAFFSGASQFDDPTPAIASAALIVTIPIIVLVLIFQRKIVAGLTSGAVKG